MDKELKHKICKWAHSLSIDDEFTSFHKWNRAIKRCLVSNIQLGSTTWPSNRAPLVPWTPQAFCQDSVERIIRRWHSKNGIDFALTDDDVFEMTKTYCENLGVKFDPEKFETLNGR